MYGTVARIRVRPDRTGDFLQEIARYDELDVAGFVGTHVYQMDADPNEFYMAVLFEDRETYRRNAEDPEQDRRYHAMLDLLVEPPDWHDGEVVWSSGR